MTNAGRRGITGFWGAGLAVATAGAVAVGTAGCGARSGESGGAAQSMRSAAGAAVTPAAPGSGVTPVAPAAPCPSGTPLPNGQGQSRDYVDEVRFNGRIYYAPPGGPVTSSGPSTTSGASGGLLTDPAKLGPVLGTVRCSKFQHDSNRRGEPEWTDPGSTFVPDGGPIYAVAGVPAECQVAARSNDGRLRLYTAQAPNRPANCPP